MTNLTEPTRTTEKESLWSQRSFVLIWLGQAVSVLGDPFGTAAQAVLLYQLTGSKVAMGTLWFALLLPAVIVRMVGGPLVDRWNRRTILIISDWVRALTFLIPAVLYAFGLLQVWHLYVCAVVTGVSQGFFQPTLLAMLPGVVKPSQLTRANASLEGTLALMSLLGPAIGTGLVELAGPVPALLIDTLTFAISGVMVMFIRQSQLPPHANANRRPFSQELYSGYAFFWKHRELLWLGVLVAVLNLGNMAIYAQMLPYASEHLKSNVVGMGLLQSAYFAGSLLGSTIAGAWGETKGRRWLILSSLIICGLMNAGMGLARHLWLAILLNGIGGVSARLFTITNTTVYQKLVPNEYRGRVMAIRMLLGQGTSPIGAFLGGVAAQAFGLSPVFIVAGLIPALVAAWALFQPTLRTLDGELQPKVST